MFIGLENIKGEKFSRRTRDIRELVRVGEGGEAVTKVFFNGRDSHIVVKDDYFELVKTINILEEKKYEK